MDYHTNSDKFRQKSWIWCYSCIMESLNGTDYKPDSLGTMLAALDHIISN